MGIKAPWHDLWHLIPPSLCFWSPQDQVPSAFHHWGPQDLTHPKDEDRAKKRT